MDGSEIVTAIGSLGFPIIACIGLFSLYDKTIKEIVITMNNVKSTLDSVNTTLHKIDSKLEKD